MLSVATPVEQYPDRIDRIEKMLLAEGVNDQKNTELVDGLEWGALPGGVTIIMPHVRADGSLVAYLLFPEALQYPARVKSESLPLGIDTMVLAVLRSHRYSIGLERRVRKDFRGSTVRLVLYFSTHEMEYESPTRAIAYILDTLTAQPWQIGTARVYVGRDMNENQARFIADYGSGQ